MRVIDPGHVYDLDSIDGGETQRLRFVKRVGDGYPGNQPPAYGGTQMQEVLRALIDRARYVNHQISCTETELAIAHMQAAVYLMEVRHAKKHGRSLPFNIDGIEREVTCRTCGHIACLEHV